MNKMIKLASVVAVTVALAQSLQAVPINGSIGFSGVGVTFDTGTALTATAVTSFIAPDVSGISGTFAAPSPFAIANGTPAVFNPATWTFVSGPVASFWTVGGFPFNLLASHLVSHGGTPGLDAFVVAAGTGTVSGNGYTPTQMSWSFTSQDPASGSNPTSWSFSASANSQSVPDGGATVMLLGIALSGVALLRKKLAA